MKEEVYISLSFNAVPKHLLAKVFDFAVSTGQHFVVHIDDPIHGAAVVFESDDQTDVDDD